MKQGLKNETGGLDNARSIVLDLLRDSLETKDLTSLRTQIDFIQRMVQAGGLQCTPMTDQELSELAETGEGVIYVGTGTSGQRIYIQNGELFMNRNSQKDADLGSKYHNNFCSLFGLPFDGELRVSYK